MDLRVDELFASRYRLIKQIGVGGFSEVWLAQDEMAGGYEIALKIYAPERGLDDKGLKQFQKEFLVTANLNHLGLLKASHYDIVEGSPYLVMPFCRNSSLASLLIDEDQLSERMIVEVIHQCSDALKYLHSKEILHQDIKPDNILINDEGKYLLTDFGISSRMRSTLRKSTNTQKALTLAYAPPERFAARQESLPAGDIFSMGITIYELATGDVPWMGAGGSVIKADTEAPLLPDDYSIGLVRLMQKCLHYDPSLRPTAEELHNVTGQYLRTGSWPDDRRPKGRATEIITPSDKKQEKKESEKKKEQPSVRKTEKKKAIKPNSGPKTQQDNKPKKDSVIGRRVKQKRKAPISVIIVLAIIIGTIVTVQFWPSSDSQLAAADLQPDKNPEYVLTDSASSETDPENIDVNNPNASEQKEGETTNERNEPVENNNPIETNSDPPQIIEDQAEDTSNNIEESNQEVPDESIEETESNQAAGDTAAVVDLEMIDDPFFEEEEEEPEPEVIYTVAEEMPSYPGGMTEFYEWISENIVYPAQARRMGIEGRVFVQFIVRKDGDIDNISVLRGIGAGCDEEAIRIIKNSPTWLPGKQRGQTVNVRMTLPITFRLNDVSTASSTERTISGMVTNSKNGETMPGVNIVLKGTTRGTITDLDGRYRISIPSSGGVLVFSFVKYRTQQVDVGSRSIIDVSLRKK